MLLHRLTSQTTVKEEVRVSHTVALGRSVRSFFLCCPQHLEQVLQPTGHFRLLQSPGQSNQNCLPASCTQLLSVQHSGPSRGPQRWAPAPHPPRCTSTLHALPSPMLPSCSFTSGKGTRGVRHTREGKALCPWLRSLRGCPCC